MTLHATKSLEKRASFAAIGFVAAVAAVLAVTAAPAVAGAPEVRVNGRPSSFADRFPNVVLKTHEGKTVRFYDDLLEGKIVMINFMYATCKGR
jgi:cytochrome oxidase Cu insertion factor (SCO1/SenC/PrrC family)